MLGQQLQTATFGAGCFWGVEETFRKTNGVIDTAVGYSGGDFDDPTYQDVSSGNTGHAEVVQVIFDPKKISYDDLLQVFWSSHDPTTLNRQGPDVGTQYRSVIFFHNKDQKAVAESSLEKLEQSHQLGNPIVTTIEPARVFYRAEEYHQRYIEKGGAAACHI